MVQQNPALLNAILQQIGQTNPALLQMISQNQDAFFRMLTEPSSGAASGAATPAASRTEATHEGQEEGSSDYFAPGVIHVTPQDKEAIERVSFLYSIILYNNIGLTYISIYYSLKPLVSLSIS